MDNNRLRYLLSRHFDKTLIPEEQAELSHFLNDPEQDAHLELLIEEAWMRSSESDNAVFGEPGLQPPVQGEVHKTPVRRMHFLRWAAAVLLLIAAGTTWMLISRQQLYDDKKKMNDPEPGSNKAVLTLGDGASITLDSSLKGRLAMQGNVQLNARPGVLSYSNNTDGAAGTVTYNTLTTPKGGQYQLQLPDGSKVWLNAASSLKYPTAFTGKERRVVLTGEAYFEIAANSAQPFFVTVSNADIAVLGTSFNVMAYRNEITMATTLLEGAVKVSRDNESGILKPGEQLLMKEGEKIRINHHADTEQAVAWKNGFTSFKGADIRTIMRQVERWYDVEVIYSGDVPARSFTGDIPRDAHLSELLKILEVSRIKFKLEGRRLTVIP
jgi:ferric-dicitrate binding protein FerR (iron transport regulator)